MIVQAAFATLWCFSFHASVTHGFLPSLTTSHHRIPDKKTNIVGGSVARVVVATTTTRLFENKLWDRMEIEEDEEPMWYVLNCVAGLEIDLLRQCRQRCEGMEDVVKFVVPMVTNTRSHGANRMVKDTKVKYQGYVFAKLRLCPQTYEAIQGLDLCRSWMGTINYKGMRKLPPAPVALNEEEVANFGLEECEDEFAEETESDDVIVDTAEADDEAAEFEETIQKVYKGLRVNDMVKVTAKNKFYDEDALVRRLKDGKVFLRFYTYGSMYEEWMDPGDIRKLSSIEILKGLSGPQQPLTQRDIDGSNGNERGGRYDADRRPGDLRRNLQDSLGGGPRNRRQDSTVQQYQRDADRDRQQKGDDNWNWYKEKERRNQAGGYDDGVFEIRGSERNSPRRGNRDAWTQGDVDSQWGRNNQREKRQERRQPMTRKDDGGDWSAFVSPSKQRPSKDETDDFFASLMADLSNDLDSERRSTGPSSRNSKSGNYASTEDDFFASLISEIEQESSPSSSGKGLSSFGSDEDDFFSSLVNEIQLDAVVPQPKQSKPPNKVTKKTSAASDDTDFFQSIAAEIESSSATVANTESKNTIDELDDFFSDLDLDVNGEPDDFFAGLQTELDSELAVETPPKPAKKAEKKKESDRKVTPTKPPAKAKVSAPAKTIDVSNLDKCTVPELKEMLREKGLKVTGKKSELIDRLTQS